MTKKSKNNKITDFYKAIQEILIEIFYIFLYCFVISTFYFLTSGSILCIGFMILSIILVFYHILTRNMAKRTRLLLVLKNIILNFIVTFKIAVWSYIIIYVLEQLIPTGNISSIGETTAKMIFILLFLFYFHSSVIISAAHDVDMKIKNKKFKNYSYIDYEIAFNSDMGSLHSMIYAAVGLFFIFLVWQNSIILPVCFYVVVTTFFVNKKVKHYLNKSVDIF